MLARLLALFLVLPPCELLVLIWLGRRIGFAPTAVLVLASAAAGAALARWQGLAAIGRFRAALAARRTPHREIVDGLIVVVAGALLVAPGLITDVAGLLLLLPPVRRRVVGRIVEAARRRYGVPPEVVRRAEEGVVEADFRVLEDGGGEGAGARRRDRAIPGDVEAPR